MPQLLPPQEPIHRRQKLFSVLIGSERGRWIRKRSVKAFEDPRARSRQPPGQVGLRGWDAAPGGGVSGRQKADQPSAA
jgi:hypothetical protein